MLKKIEQFLKKFLLKILVFKSKNLNRSTKITLTNQSNVLFIRLNRIGDALVSTPTISLIKRKSNSNVFVLADKKNHFVFRNNPFIDHIIVFEKGLKGFFKTLKLIKQNKIHVIVDLHDDISTTVSFLIALAKTGFKVGFHKNDIKIYTHTVIKPDTSTTHIIDRLLTLTTIFGIQKDEHCKVEFFPGQESLKKGKEIIEKKFTTKKFLLGINISAGSDARFWGIENFRQLIKTIEKFDVNIILFSDPKDADKAEKITDTNYIFPITKDFHLFSAGIFQLNMLFTPDTAAVHLASIKKIPVFGLYVKYMTIDSIWSPYNTPFDCIITEESNLKNVKFSEVINKFIPFLEKHLNVERNTQM